jgi:hypothetical protein
MRVCGGGEERVPDLLTIECVHRYQVSEEDQELDFMSAEYARIRGAWELHQLFALNAAQQKIFARALYYALLVTNFLASAIGIVRYGDPK